jgi:hypothetical protein
MDSIEAKNPPINDLSLTSDADGTSVQCPSGAIEHHTSDELKMYKCGRSSFDCISGACP